MSDTDARVPWLDLLLLFSASRIALLIVGILSTGLVGSGLAVMKEIGRASCRERV